MCRGENLVCSVSVVLCVAITLRTHVDIYTYIHSVSCRCTVPTTIFMFVQVVHKYIVAFSLS